MSVTYRKVSLSVPIDTEIEADIDIDDFVDALDDKDREYLLTKLGVPSAVTRDEINAAAEAVFYDYYGKEGVADSLRQLIWVTCGRTLA